MSFKIELRKAERVYIGADAAAALLDEFNVGGFRRPLMIVSKTLNAATQEIHKIKAALENGLDGLVVEILDGIGAHSPITDVFRIVDQAKIINADVLITIGGGSIIDATKAAQACLSNGIDSVQELDNYTFKMNVGSRRPTKTIKPSTIRQIAIPTTIAAAEYTGVAGITNTENGQKVSVVQSDLCPVSVIQDPTLCQHTPNDLWYSTGMRAIDHAVEGYLSERAPVYLKQVMLGAITLLSSSLRDLKAGHHDEYDCRSRAQQGAWLASESLMRVPSGASHGLGYIIGGKFGVPHGVTSCIFLPAVVKWNNLSETVDQAIAHALGTTSGAADALVTLVSELELPHFLDDVGIDESQWDEIAAGGYSHPVVMKNYRRIESQSCIMEILALASRPKR